MPEETPPPAGPTKKQLIAAEVDRLEDQMKVMFGGVHEELAEIIAKIRGHLA